MIPYRPEIKASVQTGSDGSIAIGGAILLPALTSMGAGDTNGQRTANRIQPRHLTVRYIMTNDVAAGVVGFPVVLRVVMFKDTQMNNTVPTLLQLFGNESDSITANVLSFQNEKYPGRFKFLHDKIYSINIDGQTPVAGGTGGVPMISYRVGKCRIKFSKNSPPILFTGVNSTDYQNNHIFIAVITNNDQTGSFHYQAKMTYTDS